MRYIPLLFCLVMPLSALAGGSAEGGGNSAAFTDRAVYDYRLRERAPAKEQEPLVYKIPRDKDGNYVTEQAPPQLLPYKFSKDQDPDPMVLLNSKPDDEQDED